MIVLMTNGHSIRMSFVEKKSNLNFFNLIFNSNIDNVTLFRVPTVQSCYESPRASANRGWQTCRNPPAARSRVPVSSKPTVRQTRVRQESTPRRVIPAKLSAVPGNISPKKKPSPRVKKTSPYAERF